MGNGGGGGGAGGGSSNLSFNYPGIDLPDIPALLTAPAAIPVPKKKINDFEGGDNPAVRPWWQSLTGNRAPVNATGNAPTQTPALIGGL